MRRAFPAAALVALLASMWAGPATAQQTPFTAVGLGYPTPAVDARAAALGGVGTGLMGGTFSVRSPADLTEFEDASLSVSAAPEGVTVRDGSGQQESGRSRFSVMRAVVPLGAWSASVGFASELDQDWSFRRVDTLDISTGRFPFEERRENDGGVSSVDLALARSVGPVSAGLSVQRLTGELRQEMVRQFSSSLDGTVSAPNSLHQARLWSHRSWRIRAGAAAELGDRVRVAGSYAWTGDLEAEDEERGVTRRYSMPEAWTLGTSARLSDDWLASAGGGWTGWSTAGPDMSGTRARDVHWAGGGVEFTGLALGSLPLALRAGARFTELPFAMSGREFAREEAISAGLGSSVASGRAELDLSVESGSRGEVSSTGTEESFTRFTVTVTIHQ